MPLDFRLRFILWLQSLRKEPSTNSVTDYRITFNRSVAQFTRLTARRTEPVWKVENTLADTSDGPVPVRIYTPRPEAGLPILLYYHGGGFVVGTLDLYDRTCRTLARYADCIVISVDYRLAPEHPFPAAANDAYELALWTARNAGNLGGDAQRIAVMGDSAGANLATVTAMQVRDKGGPNLVCQVMIYPVTDSTGSHASRKTLATGYFLTLEKIDWYTAHYLPADIDRKHPYHSPIWSDNLTNLPPALVITAEYDPLRDEGEAYARQLEKAGVPVTYRMYKGMIHGFFELPRVLPTARRAIKDVITTLQLAFSKSEGDTTP